MTKAFESIKRGLDEALAYADGDTSRAITHRGNQDMVLAMTNMFPVTGKVYMGIDPSLTSTGWCVISNGKLKSGRFVSKKLKGCPRLQWFADEIEWLLGEYPPDVVCLEGYAFAARGRAHSSGELGGVYRLALHKAQIKTWIISPTNLKRFVTEDGHAKKSLIIKSLYKKWDVDIDDEDEADAAALAIYALALGGVIPLTKVQTTAIKKAEELK